MNFLYEMARYDVELYLTNPRRLLGASASNANRGD